MVAMQCDDDSIPFITTETQLSSKTLIYINLFISICAKLLNLSHSLTIASERHQTIRLCETRKDYQAIELIYV